MLALIFIILYIVGGACYGLYLSKQIEELAEEFAGPGPNRRKNILRAVFAVITIALWMFFVIGGFISVVAHVLKGNSR